MQLELDINQPVITEQWVEKIKLRNDNGFLVKVYAWIEDSCGSYLWNQAKYNIIFLDD